MDFQTHTHTFTHSFAHNLAKKNNHKPLRMVQNWCKNIQTHSQTLYKRNRYTHTHINHQQTLEEDLVSIPKHKSLYYKYTITHTHSDSQTHTQSHTYTQSHTHTQSHTQTESHTHRVTHTQSHTHTKSHTHLWT